MFFHPSQKPGISYARIGDGSIQTVNARDLHEFLEVGKDFSNWIKDQIKRARLVENRDFVVYTQKGENPLGGRSSIEYHLTIEAGKHIGMMSGTDKGFDVRDYFIECERRAKQLTTDPMQALNDPAAMRGLLLTYCEKVLELQPKADALDRISSADGSLCLRDAAKALQVSLVVLTYFKMYPHPREQRILSGVRW
jgi:phage anti-repressor protein